MRTRLFTAISLAALAACAATPPANEQVSDAAPADTALGADRSAEPAEGRAGPAATTPPEVLARFAPRPESGARINYDLIDEALDLIVFNAGPSLRERQGRPDPMVGSRIAKGHTSSYRLEGNKVFFSFFDDDVKTILSEYRASLESIGASGVVPTLGRNEQLAYWLNLHNMVVLDEIARAYPVRNPRRMRLGEGNDPFHDAAIIDLGDVQLSLRDVREIVFTHWSDPIVAYGFFRGDIGSPSVRSQAYTGAMVGERLERQAREFVNSLRGVRRGRRTLYVSEIYDELRPHHFPVWPGQLTAHLLEHADDEVAEEIRTAERVAYARYEERVADMVGGDVTSDLGFGGSTAPEGSRAQLEQNGVDRNRGTNPAFQRMVREYEEKIERLQQRGRLKPRIIIIDVPTDDPDEVD